MKSDQKFQVHPAAEVFPMLPDDELQELAADIKANGLREPIKTCKGVLIDGRNRLAACRIAGVEPRIEELDGSVEPVDYILSVNIRRRHLSKGQRAMAVAMVYPEKGRGKSQIKSEFSADYLLRARTILSVLPEVAAQVRDGIEPLNEAYEKAKAQRQAVEDKGKTLQSLRAQAPDLAELVDEDRMKLIEAVAAMEERKSDERNQRQAIYELLKTQKYFAPTLEAKNFDHMIETIKKHPGECSITEIRKLAGRLAVAWSNLEKALE